MQINQTMSFEKLAIIADVVNSREIVDRNDFQLKLKILLESINNRFENELTGKFRITMGDEFQGLLHNAEYAMVIIDEINLSLYPVKIRWGLGIGELSTTSGMLDYRELDGPAYWNARRALEYITKYNYYGNNLTYIQTSKDDLKSAKLLNSIFQLQDTIRLSWTSDQSRIIEYLVKEYQYGDFVQKDVAKALKLSPQRISNVLAATSYKQYANSRTLSLDLLREVMLNV